MILEDGWARQTTHPCRGMVTITAQFCLKRGSSSASSSSSSSSSSSLLLLLLLLLLAPCGLDQPCQQTKPLPQNHRFRKVRVPPRFVAEDLSYLLINSILLCLGHWGNPDMKQKGDGFFGMFLGRWLVRCCIFWGGIWTSQFILGDCYVDVSENNATPKSSILIGFSIINHPFWGTPIFGNTHIVICNLRIHINQPVEWDVIRGFEGCLTEKDLGSWFNNHRWVVFDG